MTDQLTIRTNNVPRDIIDAWELTAAEREEFDYIDWPAIEEGTDSASFFRYKGSTYDLGDFQNIHHEWGIMRGSSAPDGHPFLAWDGFISDSFFSGILIRYVPDSDYEQIIVATYYS